MIARCKHRKLGDGGIVDGCGWQGPWPIDAACPSCGVVGLLREASEARTPRLLAELEAGNLQLGVLVEHGNKCQTDLWRVAIEAAAMLAETNHGGLTFERSESMRLALEAAGVLVP